MTNKDIAIVESFGDIENFVAQGKFKEILHKKPNQHWIKSHPFAKGVDYIPIGEVETMLDMIFREWRVEILSVSQLAQSICCTVRLHYLDPIKNEWSFHDGVGAVPLKTDKGFSAADLSHIKSDAVATGAPAAKSFAIKDAAEHLGPLFGRDLNRKDTAAYQNIFGDGEQGEGKDYWLEQIGNAKNLNELRNVWARVPIVYQGDKEIQNAKDAMKEELQ